MKSPNILPLALAGALTATSCSSEQILPVAPDEHNAQDKQSVQDFRIPTFEQQASQEREQVIAKKVQLLLEQSGLEIGMPPKNIPAKSINGPGSFIVIAPDQRRAEPTERCAVQFTVSETEISDIFRLSVLLHGKIDKFKIENAYNGDLGHAEGLVEAINGVLIRTRQERKVDAYARRILATLCQT
jgi:hypothetical protein